MINFSCAQCGINITVDPQYAGVTSECPSCGSPLVVPKAPIVLSPITMASSNVSQRWERLQKKESPANDTPVEQKAADAKTILKLGCLGICGLSFALMVLVVTCGGKTAPTPVQGASGYADSANETSELVNCNSCGGAGASKVSCVQCRGSRTITTSRGFEMVCPKCQGMGSVALPCGSCGGAGKVPYSRENLFAPRKRDYNPNDSMGEYN